MLISDGAVTIISSKAGKAMSYLLHADLDSQKQLSYYIN